MRSAPSTLGNLEVARLLDHLLPVEVVDLRDEIALTGSPEDVAAGRLREIRIGPPRVMWTLSMATRPNSRPSLAVRALAQEIRRVAAEKIAGGELRGRVLRPASG